MSFETATIKSHRFGKNNNETPYFEVIVETSQGNRPIQIWLSDKAMQMARAQIKKCGFDIDKESLDILMENEAYLAGNQLPVEIYEEEYHGKFYPKTRIATPPIRKQELGPLQEKLRAVGKADTLEDDIPF